MKSILVSLIVMAGLAPAAFADNEPAFAVGVVDALPLDRPAGTVSSTKATMLGIQVDAGLKGSPYSIKYQWRNGTVGGGLKATEQNIYAVYNFAPLKDTILPYAGLGYSRLSLTGNNANGLGWIVGGDVALGKSIRVGVFYNGYDPANAVRVYNHFIGASLKYSFM